MENNSQGKMITGAVAVLAIVGVVFGLNKMKDKEVGTTSQGTSDAAGISPTQNNQSGTTVGAYKDGTYTSIGKYNTPAGQEEIAVNITLQGGVITNAQVGPQAKAPESRKFQSMFIDGFRPYVVGKTIDSVQLSKVSGASLTPKGFNEAIEAIKLQAKS